MENKPKENFRKCSTCGGFVEGEPGKFPRLPIYTGTHWPGNRCRCKLEHIHIIFDGPPSHESGRFVEVETPDGKGLRFGEWVERDDGYWALVIPLNNPPPLNT